MSTCSQQVYFFQRSGMALLSVQSLIINSLVGSSLSHLIPCKSEKVNRPLPGQKQSLCLSPQKEEQNCCVVIFSASSSQSILLYNFLLFRISPFSQCPKGKCLDKHPIHLNRSLQSQNIMHKHNCAWSQVQKKPM